MIKVAVGIPAYGGHCAAGQARMWIQFGAAVLKRRGDQLLDMVAFANVDVCGIDHARNHLIDIGRAARADWLLMIDSDTWVDPGAGLVEMIIEAEKEGAAMVGAPVPLKDGEHVNTYKYNDEGRLRLWPVPQSQRQYKVDGVGGAVIAVHLERIAKVRFKFTEATGEDLEFCHQLNQQKKILLCDPRIHTFHRDRPNTLLYDPNDVVERQPELPL